MIKGQVVRTLWDRLWSKVAFPEGDMISQCWEWRGAKSKKRSRRLGVQYYRPVIQLAGRGSRVVLAARLVCEWVHGPAPDGSYEAGHTCPDGENELCVSPHHLRWMTRLENEQHKAGNRKPVTNEPSAHQGSRAA